MEMVNVQDVTRKAASQLSGVAWTLSDGSTVTSPEIAALESFDVTDVGKVVVDPTTGEVVKGTAETFLQAAISLIARIEIDARAYSGDLRDFMVKDSEWGGFLERVYYELADIIDDPKWRLMENWKAGKRNYAAEENGFYPAQAVAKVFQEAKGLLTPISRPSDQLKEACRSWEDMQAFLTAIQTAVRNTIELGLQSLRHMMAQDAIAVSIANTGTAINLLTQYKTETGNNTITAATALQDPDFLTYALQTISETRDNMKTFNEAFNDGTVPTFTDDEYSKLILLNKFDKAARFKVKASTFNRDDLAVGEYTTTSSWQGYNAGGTAKNFDFQSVSKVMVAADANNKLGIGTAAATFTGVVGLLFDRYALGICPYKRKVTGNYVSVTDHFNEFHHTLVNMVLDTKYPIVAFYIADNDWTPST